MRFLKYLKYYLPEVISNLLGAFAWYRIIYFVWPLGFGMDLWFWVVTLSMGAALIATPFYRLMRKPGMRRHFALYMLPLLILAPGLVLNWFMYDFAMLVVIAVLAAVPVFPFCAVYERLFSHQFTKEANSESEQDEQA